MPLTQQEPESSPGQPAAMPETPLSSKPNHQRVLGHIGMILGLLLLIGSLVAWMTQWHDQTTRTQSNTPPSTSTPLLQTETILSGRQHIWEIAFLPSGDMLFTERAGVLSMLTNGQASEVARISDVRAVGEGGLMGMAVDPAFAENRLIYTCYNSTAGDVRIVRWRLADDLKSLQGRLDIVTGMPAAASGRHSGCRIAFGPDGYLWAGTGDSAQGDTSIQPKSLGGKVLRIDRDGSPAPNNLTGEYDARIYSFGHRNVQGIAFFQAAKNGTPGLSVEHGPGVDDEVNELKPGNFGWAPPATGYDESVPMTDLTRFPDAVPAIWSSGNATQAPAGAVIIKGAIWQGWEGAVATAFLKGEHLKVLRLDGTNKVTKEERILASEFGRLRAVAQGPDGSLYVGSSNGDNDKILKLTPKAN